MQINQFNKAKGHIIGKRNFNFPKEQEAIPPTSTVTWDITKTGPNITLSNGDLTAAYNSATQTESQVLATLGRSEGKHYFEVLIGLVVTPYYEYVGVQNGDEALDVYLGSTADGWGYQARGRTWHTGGIIAPTATPSTDDVMCIAVNLDEGKIWWGINGTWLYHASYPSSDPSTNTSPFYSDLADTIYPAIMLKNNLSALTAHFKSSDMDYAIPSGFSAWES